MPGSEREKKPVGELENWNLDRTVDPYVMIRGIAYKSGGAWNYWDKTITAESGEAADMRVSAIQMDASLLRVSALGVNIADISNNDADDFRVSAFQRVADNLRISAFSNDAGTFRVSAFGVNITDVENLDADDFRVSAFSDDAGTFRTSSFIDSGSVSALVANEVSAMQIDAGRLRTSCFSDDAGTFRVSSFIDSGSVSALIANEVSAMQVDASRLRVSAFSDDASLFRTSSIVDSGSISAMQGDSGNLRVSAFSNDAGLVRVSASIKYGQDTSTSAVNSIDYAHHEIHSGDSFTAGYNYDTGSGASIMIHLKTPDTTKWGHLLVDKVAQSEAHYYMYENPSLVTDGDVLNVWNKNRNSSTMNGISAYAKPTVSTVSTANLLYDVHFGNGKQLGGEERDKDEFMLKQNTDYLLVLQDASGATNWLSMVCNWYEHTNKGN